MAKFEQTPIMGTLTLHPDAHRVLESDVFRGKTRRGGAPHGASLEVYRSTGMCNLTVVAMERT
jgi:hypothetical protein